MLSNLSEFSPKYSGKNSIDFTKKLTTFKLCDNSKFVTFDVQNLFTNIPKCEVLNLVSDILVNCDVDMLVIQELLSLVEICISHIYFLFESPFYTQPNGLAMGSPLSPLLAEIFMSNFEAKLFAKSSPLLKHVK